MRTLILFGHPAIQNSTINKGLINGLNNLEDVTFHDLYEAYPEMDIDIDREQELLSKHDCIVFMCPLYWYSTPAIFKEWQDLVLEHGWAYGSKGRALEGKLFFCAMTTGASRQMYNSKGLQNHTVKEFLYPLNQMAILCNMTPLPPFITHGGHVMEEDKLQKHHKSFQLLLHLIAQDKLDINEVTRYDYLNDFIDKEA